MKKIAVTTTSFGKYDDSPLKAGADNGLEFVINPYGRRIEPDELVKLAKDAAGIIAGTEFITRETLQKLSGIRVISRCGAGIDNIDLDAAKKLGIKVFSAPDAATIAVAELTVGLILNLLRRINQADSGIRNNKWDKLMGNLLCRKKIGIIGFGRIGQKVAQLLKPFDAETAYCDIEPKPAPAACQSKCLDKILQWADIITLHADRQPAQGHIVGARELGLMKKGSWLVNLSRGGLVDEQALRHFLQKGRLRGAALDVFAQEPYTGPLKDFSNVILTPHIGSYAIEARVEMEIQAVENILKGLKAGHDKGSDL